MATSTITIFKTDLTPDKNALVEDLNLYLGTCTVSYYETDFQYIKIGLDITIKIDVDQSYVANDYLGNYLKITEDNMNYYYFIMGTKWVSKGTVELELSLDTVNTFADKLVWNNNTKILRQHKDRFSSRTVRVTAHKTVTATPIGGLGNPFTVLQTIPEYQDKNTTVTVKPISNVNAITTSSYNDSTGVLTITGLAVAVAPVILRVTFTYDGTGLVRDIDWVDEGINPVHYKISETPVKDTTEPDTKWYLIYKSDSTATEYQPVKCYCCADKDILYETGGTYATITINRTELARGDALWFIYDQNDSDNQVIKMTGAHPDYTFTVNATHPILKVFRPSNGDYLTATLYNTDGSAYHTYTDQNNAVLILSYRYWKLATNNIQSEYIKANGEYHAALSGTINEAYINGINSYDRTEPTNIKIIELAYAPFNVEYDAQHRLQIPTGWVFDGNYSMLRLPDINSEFLNTNLDEIDLNSVYLYNHTPSVTEAHRIDAESKLYNSEFRTIKLVYDNQSALIKPEFTTISNSSTNFNFKVDYKPSNNISSACGWHFYPADSNNSYQQEGDYSSYLLSNRDNEYPVFNSAWLNYNKYGRKYDKAANTASIIGSVAGAAASVGSTIALLALGPGGGVLAASKTVAKILSIGSAITTMSINIANTVNSQKAKEKDLLAQAASVSATNDLNLLKWYNGNSLELMVYDTGDTLKTQAYNFMRLFGYACCKYEVPVTNTRYWYNFIQCEPSFNDETTQTYHQFVDEIKQRYKLGVTVYHNHSNTWDFNQQYENWEVAII